MFRAVSLKIPRLSRALEKAEQMTLFDPRWIRDSLDLEAKSVQRSEKKGAETEPLRLYLGPELVKSA
jgi:hypothetical protein